MPVPTTPVSQLEQTVLQEPGQPSSGGATAPTTPRASQVRRTLAGAKRTPDGSGWILPGTGPMNDAAFARLLDNAAQIDYRTGASHDDVSQELRAHGLNFGMNADTGSIGSVSARADLGGTQGYTGGGASPAGVASAAAGGGGGSRYTGGSGGGGSSGGGGGGGLSFSGGGGGGRAPTQGYNAGAAGPGGPAVSTSTEIQGGAGGGSGGTANINPNAPLGLDPSRGAAPGTRGGSAAFGGGSNPFPGAGSVLEGIDRNSTLNDVMLGVVRRQEANRDAALNIYGGAYNRQTNDPTLQAARGLAQRNLANPYSLDDQTVSRMMGQQGDLIGANINRLKQGKLDRAAAQGMGTAGSTQTQLDRLDIAGVRNLGNAQRGLLIEQATRRPQEEQRALESAGGFGQRDVQQGADIAMRAADQVHGQTSILGDALVSGVLMGGPGQNGYMSVGEMNQGHYTPHRVPIY